MHTLQSNYGELPCIFTLVRNVTPFNYVINIINYYVTIIQVYTFEKEPVTEENIEDMLAKLVQYGVTLPQYQQVMQLEEIAVASS